MALFGKKKSTKKEISPNKKMEHPKILLIDMDKDLYNLLEKENFNVQKGTLGKKYKTSIEIEEAVFTQELPNLEEQEIIIIDNSLPMSEILAEDKESEKEIRAERFIWMSQKGQNYFNPRPLVGFMLTNSFAKIFEAGGIIITFASEKYEEDYITFKEKYGHINPRSMEESTHDNFDFLPFHISSENNFRRDIFLEPNIFEKTFRRYLDSLESEITFNLDKNDYILAKDKFGEPVSFVRVISTKENSTGFFFVLPLSSNRNKIIIELMTEVLPSLHPNIFPDIANFKWIDKEDYLSPTIKKFVNDKKTVRKEFKNKIKEINDKIHVEKQKYDFLYGILLPNSFDDTLVKNIAIIFLKFGYKNIKCPDDDIQGNKQEDIQIRDNIPILIEAKGISGKPSESDCQQVLKYIRRRQREENRGDIHGIFIVNHQRNIEPLERDTPFTKAQIGDSENSHYSLLSTWTLFKAFLSFERGELSFEDIDYCIRKPGLIKFLPRDWEQIGQVVRVFPQQNAIGINIVEKKLVVGDCIGYVHDGSYITKKIESMQIGGKKVSEGYPNQDIGIIINQSINKKFNKTIIYKVTSSNP